MSTIENHLSRWKNNRQFASTILPDYPGWIVTAVFYSCLHLVQALCVRENTCPDAHKLRQAALKQIARRYREQRQTKKYQAMQDLIDQYKALREASNHTRYRPE